jgi:hypothetical protein
MLVLEDIASEDIGVWLEEVAEGQWERLCLFAVSVA